MTKGWHWRYNKVHMATRWTIRHGLMPLWFKDLMNITEKLQFIDPTFRRSCLVPSSPLMLWEWSWNLALPSQLVTHVFPRVKNVSCFLLRVLIGCPRRFPCIWLVLCDWFDFGFTTLLIEQRSNTNRDMIILTLCPLWLRIMCSFSSSGVFV